MAFSLTKWYLDCVDTAGRTGIAYWMALEWRGLSFTLHSTTVCEPSGATFNRTSRARSHPPDRRDGVISWHSDALGCEVTCRPEQAPFGEVLLNEGDRSVDWRSEAAAADVHMAFAGGRSIHGRGYVERLVLDILPWRLPLRDLRWGRWVSSERARSMVWIDWRGPRPLSIVFVDGVRQPGPEVADGEVRADGIALALSDTRRLPARPLGNVVARARPLAALMPSSWLQVEDAKSLSVGTLRDGAGRPDRGWAIHEHVRFPWVPKQG